MILAGNHSLDIVRPHDRRLHESVECRSRKPPALHPVKEHVLRLARIILQYAAGDGFTPDASAVFLRRTA